MPVRVRRVTSEDITGLDLSQHPAEIEITTFGNRPVSELAPIAIPRPILDDIGRAIVDIGWREGVKAAEVRVEHTQKGSRLRARITYG